MSNELPREKLRRERRGIALTALEHLLMVAIKPFAGDRSSEQDLNDAYRRVSACIEQFESEANEAERLAPAAALVERRYQCGCAANGSPLLPSYCPDHGVPDGQAASDSERTGHQSRQTSDAAARPAVDRGDGEASQDQPAHDVALLQTSGARREDVSDVSRHRPHSMTAALVERAKPDQDLVAAVDAYLEAMNSSAGDWAHAVKQARSRLATVACNWRAAIPTPAVADRATAPAPLEQLAGYIENRLKSGLSSKYPVTVWAEDLNHILAALRSVPSLALNKDELAVISLALRKLRLSHEPSGAV